MGWPAAKVWSHTLSKLRQVEPWIYDFSIRVYGMFRAVRCVFACGGGVGVLVPWKSIWTI